MRTVKKLRPTKTFGKQLLIIKRKLLNLLRQFNKLQFARNSLKMNKFLNLSKSHH